MSPKWGTLGRAQDRRSAARPNDVLDEEPFGPPTDYIDQRYVSIQFVQVLTNLWYSHTYNFVTLSS